MITIKTKIETGICFVTDEQGNKVEREVTFKKPSEEPPKEHFGSWSDGENYYYAETKEELPIIPIHVPVPDKQDASIIDINSFTQEQLLQLASKLKPLINPSK